MTLAHRTLPMGALVCVAHGRAARTLRVNDRGPCTSARCLRRTPWIARRIGDLTHRAALELGCPEDGLCRVRIAPGACLVEKFLQAPPRRARVHSTVRNRPRRARREAMSHEVETMAFAHETPWHGLGTRVADTITIPEMLRAAQLDWTVEKWPLRAVDPAERSVISVEMPSDFALVRSSDRKPLGVAGSRYQVAQNADVLAFFKDFVEKGGATLETAGSLKGGRLVWGLANIGKGFTLKGGDAVKGYLLLASPHECGKAIVARVTPVRVVCANTMAMAMSGTAVIERRFSHSVAFDPAAAAEAMELVRDNLTEFERNAKLLGRLRLTDAEVIGILAPVYQPRGAEGHPDYPKAAAIIAGDVAFANPTLTKVLQAYKSAPGAVPGTGWGVLNGATYYADHVARGENQDGRLASTWLGREARRKSAVLDSLMALAA